MDKDKVALQKLFLLARVGSITCELRENHNKWMAFVIDPASHCNEDRPLTEKEKKKVAVFASKDHKLHKRMNAAADAYNKTMKDTK